MDDIKENPHCIPKEAKRLDTLTSAEVVDPTVLPEAGFQSYNKLVNNSNTLQQAFLNGESRNPHVEYTEMRDVSSMDEAIERLHEAIAQLERVEQDPDNLAVMKSSLEYRVAEHEYIKKLAELNRLANSGASSESIERASQEAQEMSERLYGIVDPEIRDAALSTVWAHVDRFASTKGHIGQLYRDLTEGFVMVEGYEVAPMRRAENGEAKLPAFSEAITWAGEYIEEKNADMSALLEAFWEEKVAEHGEGYTCSPNDIVEAFQRVVDMRDPEGVSGVSVKLAEGKTSLAWESSEMAVLVGGNRPPIEDARTLFMRCIHELGVHGQRSINGFKTDVPVLGTGLYTETPSPDYLTFEEGFAVTIESALQHNEPEWKGGPLNYYLAVAFAKEGDDFRTVF